MGQSVKISAYSTEYDTETNKDDDSKHDDKTHHDDNGNGGLGIRIADFAELEGAKGGVGVITWRHVSAAVDETLGPGCEGAIGGIGATVEGKCVGGVIVVHGALCALDVDVLELLGEVGEEEKEGQGGKLHIIILLISSPYFLL